VNQSKRDLLAAARAILIDVIKREEQDLLDTPDNIENSHACDNFRENITELTAAQVIISKVIRRRD